MPRVTTDPMPAWALRRPEIADVDGLVVAARAGDRHAWARLYQIYFEPLFRHVRFLAGETTAVEDLVQEVFARALVSLGEFDARSSFSTWLHGIAINVVRNYWRSRSSTQTAHARLEAITSVREGVPQVEVDRMHLARERARAVYAVLAQMPEHLREAFVVRDLEGIPPVEAAAALGISPGNLAVRAARARSRLRLELERLGWITPAEEGGA